MTLERDKIKRASIEKGPSYVKYTLVTQEFLQYQEA